MKVVNFKQERRDLTMKDYQLVIKIILLKHVQVVKLQIMTIQKFVIGHLIKVKIQTHKIFVDNTVMDNNRKI